MKLVAAIIQPSRLEEVRLALDALHVDSMTTTEVKGYGRQKGQTLFYKGIPHAVHFLPKFKIEVAVEDAEVDAVIAAIVEAAQMERIGDGKIFVLDILQVAPVYVDAVRERKPAFAPQEMTQA